MNKFIIAPLIAVSLLTDPPAASAKVDLESCKPSTVLNKLFAGKVEKKVGKASEWTLPEDLRESLRKYWEESPASLEEKMRHTYEKTLEARVAGLNRVSRVLVKMAGRKIIDRKGWYQKSIGRLIGNFAGSHYNPLLNAVYMSRMKGGELSDFIVAFHEMQHAVDRNASLPLIAGQAAMMKEYSLLVPTPFGALTRYSLESKAIGSQWELIRMIPEKDRQLLRETIIQESKLFKMALESDEKWLEGWLEKRYRRQPFSAEEKQLVEGLKPQLAEMEEALDVVDKIAVKTIDYAHLPKQEFVEKMREFHGYGMKNILKSHYKFNQIRWGISAVTVMAIGGISKGVYDNDPKAVENTINRVKFDDVRLYLRLIMMGYLEDAKAKAYSYKKMNPKKKVVDPDHPVLQDLEKDLDQEIADTAAKSKNQGD